MFPQACLTGSATAVTWSTWSKPPAPRAFLCTLSSQIKHLEDTKVGRAVRKARDRHPDPEVQILADKMIEKWKDMVAEEYIRSKKAQAAVKKVQPAPAGPGKTLGGGGGGGGGFGGGGSTTSSVQSNTNRTGAAGAGAGQQMTIEGMMGRRGAVRGTGKFKK